MMNKCNHYLGYYYDPYREGFLPCLADQLPGHAWRAIEGYSFIFCPTCGNRIDWDAIKSQFNQLPVEDDGA